MLCGVEDGPATEGVVAADAGYVVDELSRAVVERVLRRDSLEADDGAPLGGGLASRAERLGAEMLRDEPAVVEGPLAASSA